MFLNNLVGIAVGTYTNKPLRGVELAAKDCHEVQPGVRLAFEQDLDVVAINFDAGGRIESNGLGLMVGPVEHRGKAEEFAGRGLVNDDIPRWWLMSPAVTMISLLRAKSCWPPLLPARK